MIDLYNWDYAEDIFRFVMEDEKRRDEFEHESLSMAQFVAEYYLPEFDAWYREKNAVWVSLTPPEVSKPEV